MIINKSKYCGFCQCPKSVWLKKNKNEEYVSDSAALERMASSTEICELQRGVFGRFVDVTEKVSDKNKTDQLIKETERLLKSKAKVLCKASFEFDGAYCVVDMLKREDGGFSLYRTKSSTTANHHSYMVELAYQKYILQKCGINVVSVNVINVNTSYKFNGILNIKKLFKITNVDEHVNLELDKVENNIKNLKEVLELESEPEIGFSSGCHNPYPCGFWKYCSKHLPTPSVFDLYATSIQQKVEYYNKGIVSFSDVKNANLELGTIQSMQIDHGTNTLNTHVNKDGVGQFLNGLWYPLYFLDFETVQLGIPKYKKSRPYQPTAFQYSLHYIEEEGGEVKHKEFLANPFKDPRKQIAKRLCADIPQNACVLAYNKFFERDRIKDLAKLYPKLGKQLNVVAKNVRDLMDPFTSGFVYNKDMGNSLSIKHVLPALYPNDPTLNYETLEGVQNGNDAMLIYPKLKTMKKSDRIQAQNNLLKYCKLDTLAMVKIYEYLKFAVK